MKKKATVRKGGKTLHGAAAAAVIKARAAKMKTRSKPKTKQRKNPGLQATIKKMLSSIGAKKKRNPMKRRRNDAAPPPALAELHQDFQGRPVDDMFTVAGPAWMPDDVVLLGEVASISYVAAKDHIGNGKTFEYVHKFGEEGGQRPKLVADKSGNLILLGGDYEITAAGIKN